MANLPIIFYHRVEILNVADCNVTISMRVFQHRYFIQLAFLSHGTSVLYSFRIRTIHLMTWPNDAIWHHEGNIVFIGSGKLESKDNSFHWEKAFENVCKILFGTRWVLMTPLSWLLGPLLPNKTNWTGFEFREAIRNYIRTKTLGAMTRQC